MLLICALQASHCLAPHDKIAAAISLSHFSWLHNLRDVINLQWYDGKFKLFTNSGHSWCQIQADG